MIELAVDASADVGQRPGSATAACSVPGGATRHAALLTPCSWLEYRTDCAHCPAASASPAATATEDEAMATQRAGESSEHTAKEEIPESGVHACPCVLRWFPASPGALEHPCTFRKRWHKHLDALANLADAEHKEMLAGTDAPAEAAAANDAPASRGLDLRRVLSLASPEVSELRSLCPMPCVRWQERSPATHTEMAAVGGNRGADRVVIVQPCHHWRCWAHGGCSCATS